MASDYSPGGAAALKTVKPMLNKDVPKDMHKFRIRAQPKPPTRPRPTFRQSTSSHESSSTNAGNLGRYGTPYCTLTVQYHGHTPSYAESVSRAIAAEF